MSKKETKMDLISLLKELKIYPILIEHPAASSVEEMRPIIASLTGAVPKTLFLKDRKNNLYLVSVQFDKKFKMKDLCKTLQLSSGSLSFASDALLHDILGIHSGSVSPFALVNDHDKKVKCIIDVDILKHQMVYFPPLTNTALLGLSMEKFRKFMTVIKHEIIFISI